MSGTTPEIQKTPEIKTPEELIKRLEAKSQNTLADKVRAIETTVTGNAESKWKKLQAELPDAEKQQIEKILKGENPEVGTRLKVVAATAVATAGIATVVNQLDSSMEKTGLGKFGIKDSIKEWLTEELTDVPDKDADFFDKIMHKIKMMFLLPFAKMFGVDLTKKKEGDKGAKTPEAEKNGKKEESQKDSIEKVNENISFKLGYKGFVRMYAGSLEGIEKGLKSTDIDTPFQYASFQSMTFSEAETLYKKYKGKDSKGLLLEPQCKGIINSGAAFAAIALLISGHSSEFLKKRYGDKLQSMNIKDIIGGIKDTFDIVGNIHDLEIKSAEDIAGFMGKIGEKMDFSFTDGKIQEEGMKLKAERMGITDTKLMGFVFLEAKSTPIKNFSTPESVDLLTSIDDTGKKKLKEILQFGKEIIPMLVGSCSLGNKAEYQNEFSKISPTLSDITKMYITLGGKTDFNSMTEPEQLYCYQRTGHFLGNTKFRGEYFDQAILKAISDKNTDILSPGMKRVLGGLISSAAGLFFEKMNGIGAEIYGAMKWYHIASVGAILTAYFVWGKKIVWIGQGIAFGSLIVIVADILSKFGSPGVDGKYTLPSGAKVTKEEGAEALIKGSGATL